MKKSNVIVFALLAAASVFLLWVWYFLGLNHVDEPLDLVISIMWWAVIIVAIVIIVKMEQTRRRRIRTVYVGGSATFNSEKGLMCFEGPSHMQDSIASVIENLKYDFTRNDFPDKGRFRVRYFIRTEEFGSCSGGVQPDPRKWKGQVVVVDTREERSFETSEELADILAELEGIVV